MARGAFRAPGLSYQLLAGAWAGADAGADAGGASAAGGVAGAPAPASWAPASPLSPVAAGGVTG